MFPFTKQGRIDHTEKKAVLYAFLFSALFIVLLSLSVPAKRTRKLPLTIVNATPATKPFVPSSSSYEDPLEKFRVVPANFREVDFKNFSYGVYVPSKRKPDNLTLTDGAMWNDTSLFDLQDVYYKDITGDGLPEAIVRLLHLRCNDSCDGRADRFYIYTTQNGKLKNIWRYETGSYAYGCGLKSFILGNKQIAMELFGRCPGQTMEYPGPAKFMVEDLTFKVFEFDGHDFSTKQTEFIIQSARDVRNYKPEIRIY